MILINFFFWLQSSKMLLYTSSLVEFDFQLSWLDDEEKESEISNRKCVCVPFRMSQSSKYSRHFFLLSFLFVLINCLVYIFSINLDLYVYLLHWFYLISFHLFFSCIILLDLESHIDLIYYNLIYITKIKKKISISSSFLSEFSFCFRFFNLKLVNSILAVVIPSFHCLRTYYNIKLIWTKKFGTVIAKKIYYNYVKNKWRLSFRVFTYILSGVSIQFFLFLLSFCLFL